MTRLFSGSMACGLMACGVLAANPAFAGNPVLVDGKGRAVVFETASKQQKEWNA